MFDFLAHQQQSELRARAEAATLSRSVRELALEQRRAEAHLVWWAVKEVYGQRSNWIIAGVLLATVAVALHFSR